MPGCGGTLRIEERAAADPLQPKERFLSCPKCGTEEAIDDLFADAAARVNDLRRGERQLFIMGMILFVMTSLLTYVNRDAVTFFGGAVFALLLVQRAIIFRYRAWQATNKKFFLAERPPIREWLADEFKN